MQPESDDNLQLKIGHVLFIDIVGYSRLLIEEQRERLHQLTEIVIATSQVLESTDEQLVRLPTGDGMALVFHQSAEEPARCALEIAEALRKQQELPVRMGIHSGPVSEVKDVSGRSNIAGAGINMAQRVMDCGDAGHILLSQHVADDLMQYRQWAPRLHDLGDCEVKHGVRLHLFNLYGDYFGNPAVPGKVESAARMAHKGSRAPWLIAAMVLALTIIGGALFWQNAHRTPAVQSSKAAPEKSIAVLPFENLSSDNENAYFAEGIQDEILTRLAKIADLKVISRTSTQHYKSAPQNLPEIARQLDVANILEGSVQKSSDTVRVNVQLIKAANDSHLWAETFDRKLTDIFSVESDVARSIADQLRAKLTGQEKQLIDAKPTNIPQAYDAYLRGLAYTLKSQNTPANSLSAQRYLREAVRLDPKFALSWALLSYVDSLGYIGVNLQQTDALREEARKSADTALSLQPSLGEGLVAKGFYFYAYLKDYDAAVRYFEQAREFLPNGSRIAESLAYVARRRGQWDGCESYFIQAEQLDPRNASILSQHAITFILLRRFPGALDKLDQVLNITPDDVDTIALKASIAQAEGDLPRAAALLAPLHPAPDDTPALETQVYQAILERRPEPVIPWLTQLLAKPDPTLGYYNGELRFWLGWAQQVAGNKAGAEESWRQAQTELESFLKDQPDNYSLMGDLALVEAGLGNKAAALSLADRAMAAISPEKDVVDGPAPIEIMARITAWFGASDQAIPALTRLLSIPYEVRCLPVTPHLLPALLRLDPMFGPLRNDPRFAKLVASFAPNEGKK